MKGNDHIGSMNLDELRMLREQGSQVEGVRKSIYEKK